MEIDISKFNNGALPDPIDERDFSYEQIMGAGQLPDEYCVLDELPYKIKIENQGSSSSCVGQSISKYIEILNYFDEKKQKDASAKFAYSRIFLPQGGAYIRDAMALAVDVGICEESLDLSYENGNPPSENYIRIKNETQEAIENAKVYQGKEYRSIWHKENIDIIKQAIYDNKGVIMGFAGDNEGWQGKDGIVYPPKADNLKPWGHSVLGIGWKKINGQDYLIILNSWSENWGVGGLGYIHPSYFGTGNIFSIWTLTDKQNNEMPKYQLIKKIADEDVYYLDTTGFKVQIGDAETFNAFKGQLWGEWSEIKEISADEFKIIPKAGILIKTKSE